MDGDAHERVFTYSVISGFTGFLDLKSLNQGEARPGDLARVKITSAKPHFIFGEKLEVKRTRGGDAFEDRKLEAEKNGVFLGVPQLKSSIVK